jgi:DNA-binding GntR family transcriptional regulator
MIGHTEAMRAYGQLREMIIRTDLAPGAAVCEADLMQRLGVGRTPLRDALHRLAHDGLVEILPRRGTFVTELTVRDLQHVFELCWTLQDLLARLAVERCTSAALAELDRLIALQANVPAEQGATNELDRELHELLLRIARNDYLTATYRRCRDTSARLRYLTRCGRESHADQRRFMLAVAEALEHGDAARLCEVLRDHLRAFRDRVASSIFAAAGGLAAQAS